MKNLFILLFAFTCSETFSQTAGSLQPKQAKPEAGTENRYVYTPPQNVMLPDSSKAFIIYDSGSTTQTKKVPLIKGTGTYEFSFTSPDSTKAFIAGIIDKKNKPVDTHNDNGYVVYFYDDKGFHYENARINVAQLLNSYGTYYLNLNVPADALTAMYEADYKQYPKQKDKTYLNYLSVLYKAKKDAAKPQLLQYAKQQIGMNKEENWYNALTIYRMLSMNDEVSGLNKKIISKYPTGSAAKYAMLDSIHKVENAENKIALMNDFRAKFGEANNNDLYGMLAADYEKEKNWNKYMLYVDSITNKDQAASILNNTAWRLSGEKVDNAGENLEFAKTISKKSFDVIANEMNEPEKSKPPYAETDEYKKQLKSNYDTYIDTYALILYKLNQPDSAFYYEDIVIPNTTDLETFERYAVYASKIKGNEFTRQFIEGQLSKGMSTPALEQRLKNIYAQLNLSDTDYNNMIAKAKAARMEKLKEEIKEKMKSGGAKNFSLQNLEGQQVSLASLKGKTVVVDFWATWCGPCKASFPGMQQVINKYKDDKDVVFLFVDTWERKEVKDMQTDAQDFIKQNNYSFNVLLDDKDKTVADYNVQGIPTKFVINKDGNLQFASIGFNGTDKLLEEISLMIDMTKKGSL